MDKEQFASELCAAWSLNANSNLDLLMDFFAEDAEIRVMVQPGLLPALAGVWGKSTLRLNLSQEMKIATIRLHATSVLMDRQKMAMEVESFMRFSNGQNYNNLYHWALELSGQKIHRLRIYLDTLYAQQAMEWFAQSQRFS